MFRGNFYILWCTRSVLLTFLMICGSRAVFLGSFFNVLWITCSVPWQFWCSVVHTKCSIDVFDDMWITFSVPWQFWCSVVHTKCSIDVFDDMWITFSVPWQFLMLCGAREVFYWRFWWYVDHVQCSVAVFHALWNSRNSVWQCWYVDNYLELLLVFRVLCICSAPNLYSAVLEGS